MKFNSLKGIHDIYPPDIYVWQWIENLSREVFRKFGYREIRLPVIEKSEIFKRSIGETTDIVEKEMYTFSDKGGRSVTLRPEGTASFARAFVQHHLYNEPSPQKYYYLGPMFRYENTQALRNRQFYQIGVEALGTENPQLDAEVISMLSIILKKLGLNEINFEISSIGCKKCRPDYITALKKSLKDSIQTLCEDCQRRYDSNPLRILDCKVSSCINARKKVPVIADYLCGECDEHFKSVQHNLTLLNLPFMINHELVRGLDYYTRTAFEVTSESLGSQKAVAAGGRYNNLIKEFGGPDTPGIGFAIGIERIIHIIKDSFTCTESPDLFICSLGPDASDKSFILTGQLRAEGIWVEMSYDNSSLRSQMRKADRIGAGKVIVIGDNELKNGNAVIKDMKEGNESAVSLKTADIIRALQ